ncbi:MAG: hypothetical protein U0325_16085 [Polyangiales bacterium]
MKRRDAPTPSPWPWVGASAALLAGLGFARWWMERPALQGDRVTLDEAAWVTTLRPALAARCGGCHDGASAALRFGPRPSAVEVIDELARARAWVVPGDPEASALRRRPRGEGHPAVFAPGDCLDVALGVWIRGGAPARCATDGGFALPRGLTPLGERRAPPALDLATPARALATQLALLRRMDYDDLRATFVPAAQLALTDAALDACRLAVIARGAAVPVDPSRVTLRDDGAVAELAAVRPGDRPAVFVREGDRWRANDLWCAPRVTPRETAGPGR